MQIEVTILGIIGRIMMRFIENFRWSSKLQPIAQHQLWTSDMVTVMTSC